MTRHVLILGALIAVGFAPAPLPRAKPVTKSDQQLLEGTWEMTSRSNGGAAIGVDGAPRLRVVGERMTWLYPDHPSEWEARFDQTRKPKTLDMKGLTGFATDRSSVAIYSLDGDTFTICYRQDGQRPSDLTGQERGVWRMVYRRVKP